METKLLLGVFSLLVQGLFGALTHVTVMEGHTVTLTCRLRGHSDNVEWKNPEGHVMFFNLQAASRDRRYTVITHSQSEFSISVSNITYKDGGNYTCTQYEDKPLETIVEVTVLGHPRMSQINHGGHVIKCRAEGNHHPPRISWQFDQGPEFHANPSVYQARWSFVSEAILHVHPLKNRVIVKCFVRHPALHLQPLWMFVKIGKKKTKPSPSTPTQPGASTRGPGATVVDSTTTNTNTTLTQGSTLTSNQSVSSSDPEHDTVTMSLPLEPVTSTSSHLSTTGVFSISETIVDTSFNKSMETNLSDSSGATLQTGAERTSSLLVLLVTALIFGLLVVIIFFAVKLRRAHMAWKRENEESDPSEESSKSKSVQEDKNSQGQRRRGLFPTAFTQYVVEEPAVITSVVNTNAMTSKDSVPQQTPAKCDVKETSL